VDKYINGYKVLRNHGLIEWYLGLRKVTRIKLCSLSGFVAATLISKALNSSFFLIGSLIFIMIYFAAFLFTTAIDAIHWVKRQIKNINNAEDIVKDFSWNIKK